VTSTPQTTRDPDIFAFGDCASALARRAAFGRDGAAARAGGVPAGKLLCKTVARIEGKPLPTFTSAISARWCRWASFPPAT
jgi:NADH dehydrogenase FAD-containing subunit